MLRHRLLPAVLWLITLVPMSAHAQQPDPAALSVRRIYGSADFKPQSFGPSRWYVDGSSYTTLEPAPGAMGQDIVRHGLEDGSADVLVPATRMVPAGSTEPLDVESYEWSPDGRWLLIFTNSRPVWRQNTRGDYWALDRQTWRLVRLGGDAASSTLMFAKFSPDGRRVGYVRQNDLYVEDLDTGAITRLTTDGSRTIINGTFDWVYEEELDLRDGWRWSPDGAAIAYWQLNADSVHDFNLIDNTDSLYSLVVPIQFPKAGTANSSVRAGVVAAGGGTTRWFAVDGDPRDQYLARMDWAGNSQEVVIQRLNRLQNTLDLLLADAATGSVRTILTERDSTWVEVVDQVEWLDAGRSFTWSSERDGWTHIYRVSRDGKSVRLLTPGAFDVMEVVAVDKPGGWLYYVASPGNPTQRYLYRARLDGRGTAQRLSPEGQAGTHGYDASPDAKWAIHTYSNLTTPPVLDLVSLPSHAAVRTLVDNAELASRVAALSRGPAEFFQVDIGNGIKLNGYMLKPPRFDAAMRYPVLFNVYGGPGSQTVVDVWQGSQYLWHTMLTQQGIVVMSVDNRGTGGRGRAWRKAVYGQLGVIETQDQAAAARAISNWDWVDPARIGIWGWSYGGFMSLNVLFQAADVYRMAMAVAPVTHWRYYDTIYTERYNGLPQLNAYGYNKGSPLSYVGGLRGDLLLVHGSGDDNVHFQNTEVLINALVAANKPFQLMEYPNRNHGIYGGNATVHLRELLTSYCLQHLRDVPPAAAAPVGSEPR